MIPLKQSKATKTFNILDFSGGINLSKGQKKIKDNQLSQAENMWFKEGILKTRPALRKSFSEDFLYKGQTTSSVNEMNVMVLKGERYYLQETKEFSEGNTIITLNFIGKSIIPAGKIQIQGDLPFFSVIFKDNIYIFFGVINKIYLIKKTGEADFSVPEEVTEDEIYVPLVLTNCWSCYNDSGKINAMLLKGAVRNEDFNILSNRYKMKFSQYDPKCYFEAFEGDSKSRVSYMEYGLPFTTSKAEGEIYLEYTCYAGYTHRHKVSCPKEEAPTVESEASKLIAGDDLYLHAYIKGDVCHVTLNSSKEAEKYFPDIVSVEKYINNNMTINAPRTGAQWDKVALMKKMLWYGNTSLGVNGGSRLFLGGNEKEESLLLWSDFENPLYFPESNYAYVGDKAQKITALARQGADLIIFKEREIYSTKYVQGEINESESPLNEQGKIAYFPMTLIHPLIGCDCPDSIQLLRNRLVFLNSSGKVYTVSQQNQYSEMNIYEISGTIEKLLKKEDLKNAKSADWQGFYLLFTGENVFVMDYNSYGYINAHYEENIPWFKWRLRQSPLSVYVVGENLNTVTKYSLKNGVKFTYSQFDERVFEDTVFEISEDNALKEKEEKIFSSFETKHFDFSKPFNNKTVEKVFFDVNDNKKLTVTFIEDEFYMDIHSVKEDSLVPDKRSVKTLGIRFEAEGELNISAINIRFRMDR